MSMGPMEYPKEWGFYYLMGVHSEDDQSYYFETSWLFNPWALGVIRGIISLYAFFTLAFSFAWQGTHGDDLISRRSFSYFTDLTYWGVAFYFLFAALHTFLYAKRGESVLLKRLPRVFRVLHSLLYTTITTFPFLVTFVYWAVLYKGPWYSNWFDAWKNISYHAITPLFCIFEVAFTRMVAPSFLHLPFVFSILVLYIALVGVTHATQGFYTYSFLNPDEVSNGHIAAYCAAIFGGVSAAFALVRVATNRRIQIVGPERVKLSKVQSESEPHSPITSAEYLENK